MDTQGGGRDGDRSMAKADSPRQPLALQQASPGCLAQKLSFGMNLGPRAHCFRASAAHPQSHGLLEDPKSGLLLLWKGLLAEQEVKHCGRKPCLLTRPVYNRKKWYVSTEGLKLM